MSVRAKIVWVKNLFVTQNRCNGKSDLLVYDEQSIVYHHDISNFDIIYKFGLFVTNGITKEKSLWPLVTLLTLHRLHNEGNSLKIVTDCRRFM